MNNAYIIAQIYKFGPVFGLIMFFFLLNNQEMYPNSYIWYAFLIHFLLCNYISFVNGASFGISQTVQRLAAKYIEEEEENNKNKLN